MIQTSVESILIISMIPPRLDAGGDTLLAGQLPPASPAEHDSEHCPSPLDRAHPKWTAVPYYATANLDQYSYYTFDLN